MIRIVCPFCHAPLGAHELGKAIYDGHVCLVCPECEAVLVTEDDSVDPNTLEQRKAAADA